MMKITDLSISVLANECLRLLISEVKRKGVSFRSQQIPVGWALKDSCERWDSDTEIGIGIVREFANGVVSFVAVVKTMGGEYVSVRINTDQSWFTKSFDQVRDRCIVPAMSHLATLLIQSRMPSDAPDYAYMVM